MKKLNFNKISVFTATTTNKLLLPSNPNRKSAIIKNVGSNTVEFLESERGAYGTGFPLLTLEIFDSRAFEIQGELYVISTVGDSELRVWEVISEVH